MCPERQYLVIDDVASLPHSCPRSRPASPPARPKGADSKTGEAARAQDCSTPGDLPGENMRFLALACDYDGTLARHGRVEASTIAALERVRASGRKLLLVTGRQLDDLRSVFVEVDLFDSVVAENGALLYDPRTPEAHTEHAP
jgi:hypothetical protein